MINQPVTDPLPDKFVFAQERDDGTIDIYFDTDPEGIEQAGFHLNETRTFAKAEVRTQAKKLLEAGFDSNADGEMKKYRATVEDQINIASAAAAGIATIVTNDQGKPTLTVAQIRSLNQDMVTHRNGVLIEKQARYDAINNATSEGDILAIVNQNWN